LSKSGRTPGEKTRLFAHYAFEGRSYQSISKQYGISPKTVQRTIDKTCIQGHIPIPKSAIILMDTSYFGRCFGVMVFRDHNKNRNLYWKYLHYETVRAYQEGIEYLRTLGCQISGIVCDGRRGIFNSFGSIPIQMCQYHQAAIITRYITQSPILEAGKELKKIAHTLCRTNQESFVTSLNSWHDKWADFLQEKSHCPDTEKWHYTHRRIRSAYRSLKTNLPYLFTYLNYPELHMPNTTNSLEGVFSNLKTKLRSHAGLKIKRKIKVIDQILTN